MRLHIVRHGQSTWNVEGRLQGQTMHVPLTDLGRRQAERAAQTLASTPLDALWSSDQDRAVQTAEVITAAHPHLVIRTTALLREQHLGDMEGRLARDLRPEPTPPGKHISEICWGGGESIEQVHARLRGLLAELRASLPPDAHVALVSHGDTIRVLLAALAGRGHREVEWVPVENGSVIVRDLPQMPLPHQMRLDAGHEEPA